MSAVIVFVRHVRAANLCTRGMRTWLDAHGFDLNDVVKNGIPAEVLDATGDALAARVVDFARKEAGNGV